MDTPNFNSQRIKINSKGIKVMRNIMYIIFLYHFTINSKLHVISEKRKFTNKFKLEPIIIYY